jgi:glyoxylase-like metal-dependent hydrolase (beta-lactamase superfamily II)
MTTNLSEIAPELWIAEEPLRYLGFEVGRRMAVIRLPGGELLVHSPARLSTDIRAALDALGEVRFVVPASELHGHLHMEEYRDAYPQVKLFAAPGLDRKRTDLRFDGLLSGVAQPEWSGELDQVVVEGHRRLHEIEFFHPKTRTLITGDLCCNFGPQWPLITRLMAQGRIRQRLGPPTECRVLGLFRNRGAVRRSLERILEWDFERILPGHGEIVDRAGRAAFERDFARLLR